MIISEGGRKYRIDVLEAVLKQRAVKHLEKKLKINIVVTRPDNRRRDLDNLTKALLDGLTHAGLWEDDSQIVDLHIAWSKKDGNECAEVMVEVEELDDE